MVGLTSASAVAESKVTVTKSHLCCPKCFKGAEGAVAKVEGASISIDQQTKTMTISGKDDATVKKALGALARAGFHGETDSKKLKFSTKSGVEKGKVSRLALTGVHNCCPKCMKGLTDAIGTVKGVSANTVAKGKRAFVVEGDFDGAELIAALYKAGFHARTPKKGKKGKKKE